MSSIPIARGLNNFISEIRNCNSDKAAELKRVEKELANIRSKFSASDKLNSYHKKKYIWKLVYIFVLGYDVDFGHMEAISLMLSMKYSEKLVGYAAVALMVHPTETTDELMATVVNAIRTDLDAQDDGGQCLALACISNMGSDKLAGAVVKSVQRLLVAQNSHVCVKKRAALTLLCLFRMQPDCIVHGEWCDRISTLLEQSHLGVLTSAMSLLLGFASRSPQDYEGLVHVVIHNLHSLVVASRGSGANGTGNVTTMRYSQDYLYYGTPSPWLQVKLLKFLQYFDAPTEDGQKASLNAVLSKIISRTDGTESVNKSNADHAILFEAVNLVVKHGMASDEKLRHQALTLLGRFISVREPNIRYIGLQTMARLAQVEGNEAIKKHETTVLNNLKDADISVRRRALDLLFVMCDRDNSANIVEELVAYLATADPAIREELVLKIAIIAEKYAKDLEWYVTMILQLIQLAGDQLGDDIWHRLVQVVTNNKSLQAFAAEKLFVALESQRAHETLVQVGSYVLGEFGYLIAEKPGRSGEEQFQLLYDHFPSMSHFTQHQMFTTFVKMSNLYPEECPSLVTPVFERYKTSGVLELQQRACEYLQLMTHGDEEMMEDVLREMPAWTLDKLSALEKRLNDKNRDTADGNAWVNGGSDGDASRVEGQGEDGASGAMGAQQQQQQQQQQQPSAAVSLIDLEHEPTPVVPNKATEDPLAAQPPQAPPLASTSGTIGIAEDQIPSMKKWFNDLVREKQGVLFENQFVQVALKHAYQAHQARVAVYVQNKGAGGGSFTNVTVTIPTVPFLSVTVTQAIPSTVEAGKMQAQTMAAECMQPFEVAPECTVAFTDSATGTAHKYLLRLPVVATKFMEPVPLNDEQFLFRWNQLTNAPNAPPREQQVVWATTSGKAIDQALLADIRTRILAEGLSLGPTQGPNSDPMEVTAASTFRTGAVGANGQRVSIGCLLKLEARGSHFRLTVRAVHGKIAVALKNVVKAQLS